jgi:hypothetical protein
MLELVALNINHLYNARSHIIPPRIKEHAKKCAIKYTSLKFAIAKLETTIFDLHSDFDKGIIPKQYIKQMKQIDKTNRDDKES